MRILRTSVSGIAAGALLVLALPVTLASAAPSPSTQFRTVPTSDAASPSAAQQDGGCFWCYPAAVAPPRCAPVDQHRDPYEWRYRYTRTLSQHGHGTRTHVFYVTYVNPANGMMANTSTCSIRF